MIARDFKRVALFGLPVLILLYTFVSLHRSAGAYRLGGQASTRWIPQRTGEAPASPPQLPLSEAQPERWPANDGIESGAAWDKSAHMEIFSTSTHDGKYFSIDFGPDVKGMNPNLIPHPHLDKTWIVVAQEARAQEAQTPIFSQISCNAAFEEGGGVLRCVSPAVKLPIAATVSEKCNGDLSYFNFNVGPHDARVLYGPEKPYIVYGSNSGFTCFGQWIHDFRELVGDWWTSKPTSEPTSEPTSNPGGADFTDFTDFTSATELQRPAPYSAVEKNWFPFWDAQGQMYIHYDIAPRRVLARIHPDGSSGEDLAPAAAFSDAQCLRKYMPRLPPTLESIHQATNSLRITLCSRTEAGCVPSGANTFILSIWQHKTFYHFHGVYEPYVMLFQEEAPFAVHAVSKQPIWIHGREERRHGETADMMYVTSVSWKRGGMKYHGYADDEIFLGFGIEDREAGGVDVVARDLLANLGLCLDS